MGTMHSWLVSICPPKSGKHAQTWSEWDANDWSNRYGAVLSVQTHTQTHRTHTQTHAQDRWADIGIPELCRQTHLAVRADGSPAVRQQLGHVVVAAELPQTSFQVQVPVEAQRAVPPERAAELIRRRVARAVGVARGRRDEAVTCGDLLVVQKVGAAVVSHAGSIGTECQLKVHERPGGDHWKHACEGKEDNLEAFNSQIVFSFVRIWIFKAGNVDIK